MTGMTKSEFLAVLALFVLSSWACAERASPGDRIAREVQAAARDELKNSGTPSLQIAIGKGRDVVYQGAFGLADVENEVVASLHSKYRTSSVAKWFTAAAAMRLTESGQLDLDAPIQQYCPDYPNRSSVITSRQLLTHTAGIRHYRDYEAEKQAAKSPEERAVLKRQETQAALGTYARHTDVITPLESFKDDPLLFAPGENWEYTSFGYRLLACVLQGAADERYVDLMQRLVFKPANMPNTLPDDAWALIPHRVTGYQLNREGLRRADFRDVSENLPAGGFLSTASDLVRFALAFDDGLVSESAVALMSSTVAAELDLGEPSWRDAIPQADKYGYGMMLFSKYSDGMIGHTGRQAGASSIVVLIPETDTAIAVMSNAKGWNGYLGFTMKLKAIVDQHVPSTRASGSSEN